MKLVACTPPEGFLESAPLSPLCDAIVTTSAEQGALTALEAFWCWDDDRYYVRRAMVRAAGVVSDDALATDWFRIDDSESMGVLPDDVLTPHHRPARTGQRTPAMRVRVARGRSVAAMALSLGISQRRPR
jgi:hypothetical protein